MSGKYLIFLILLVAPPILAQPQTIGILAYDGKPQAIQRWQPTADYLTRSIPDAEFHVVPLTHQDFEHAINKGELDFILTNPGHYVKLEVKFGITRIATFLTQYQNETLKQFSSVIFTRNDSPIFKLSDLKGQTLAAVDEGAFGGFQLAYDALNDIGIDVLNEVKIKWMGFPHSDVVREVLQGNADVGTVRSGILEKMALKKLLSLDQIRVLSKKEDAGFPFLHSVDLYPEWPFSKLPGTNIAIAKKVAIQLFEMNKSDTAAIEAGGSGWTIPLNYSSIHEVLKRLQVEPYPPKPASLSQLFQAYQQWIVAFILLFMITLGMLIRLVRTNQKLQQTQRSLSGHQAQLEEIVQQRTDDLLQTNQTLQIEIESHVQAEQSLHYGCEALHSLYGIFNRSDLDRVQKRNSIVEAVRTYLGTEFAILSSIQEDTFNACSTSPSTSELSAPLSKEFAQLAIDEHQVVLRENTSEWLHYIACPVHIEGEIHCLFEFASSKHYEVENSQPPYKLSQELSMSILNLIAHWVGNETRLLELEKASEHKHQDNRHKFELLSPRELEVLSLLVQGESSKSMAKKLNISPKTIEMHRANLLRKTQAKSSTELVQLAVIAELFKPT